MQEISAIIERQRQDHKKFILYKIKMLIYYIYFNCI